jgi:hypothetical protein
MDMGEEKPNKWVSLSLSAVKNWYISLQGSGIEEDEEGPAGGNRCSRWTDALPSRRRIPRARASLFLPLSQPKRANPRPSNPQSALYTHTFPFKHAQPRDDESFSVEQRGRLSVYEAGKMGEAVAAMEAAVQ